MPYGTREIFLHDGLLYVGGVGDPGVIWVVDAKTLTLKTRIKMPGSGSQASSSRRSATGFMRRTAAEKSW